MRNDLKSAYNDEHHPEHAQAVETMHLLYQAETMDDGRRPLSETKRNKWL